MSSAVDAAVARIENDDRRRGGWGRVEAGHGGGRRRAERSEGCGVAGLELNPEPRSGRAVSDRIRPDLAWTGRAQKVDDDPRFAWRQQAEAKCLDERGVAGDARATDRLVQLKVDLRQIHDNAVGRGESVDPGVDRPRKVEHQLRRVRVLSKPHAHGDGRSRVLGEGGRPACCDQSQRRAGDKPLRSRHCAFPRGLEALVLYSE